MPNKCLSVFLIVHGRNIVSYTSYIDTRSPYDDWKTWNGSGHGSIVRRRTMRRADNSHRHRAARWIVSLLESLPFYTFLLRRAMFPYRTCNNARVIRMSEPFAPRIMSRWTQVSAYFPSPKWGDTSFYGGANCTMLLALVDFNYCRGRLTDPCKNVFWSRPGNTVNYPSIFRVASARICINLFAYFPIT